MLSLLRLPLHSWLLTRYYDQGDLQKSLLWLTVPERGGVRVRHGGKCGSKQYDGSQSGKQRGHKGDSYHQSGTAWSKAQISDCAQEPT